MTLGRSATASADRDCTGTAMPDAEGQLSWLECPICGYEFAWQYDSTTETCAAGLPLADPAQPTGTPPAAVPLGIPSVPKSRG